MLTMTAVVLLEQHVVLAWCAAGAARCAGWCAGMVCCGGTLCWHGGAAGMVLDWWWLEWCWKLLTVTAIMVLDCGDAVMVVEWA